MHASNRPRALAGISAGIAVALTALTAPPAAATIKGGGCSRPAAIVHPQTKQVHGEITACISGQERFGRDRIHPDAYVKLTRAVPGCQLSLVLYTRKGAFPAFRPSCPKVDGKAYRLIHPSQNASKGDYWTSVYLHGSGFVIDSSAHSPYLGVS